MSDQRLRELERRWKETGSPDDEAAYLLERVRVGDLPRERLELAAFCGHEGARRAVPALPGEHFLKDWVYRLHATFGNHAIDRVAIAVAKLLLPCWEQHAPSDPRVSGAIDAARRRVRSRVGATCEFAREAADAATAAAEESRRIIPAQSRASAVQTPSLPEVLYWAALSARNAAMPASGLPVHVAASAAQAARLLGEATVRAALNSAMVLWALEGIEP